MYEQRQREHEDWMHLIWRLQEDHRQEVEFMQNRWKALQHGTPEWQALEIEFVG
jgi:hypothetical protein